MAQKSVDQKLNQMKTTIYLMLLFLFGISSSYAQSNVSNVNWALNETQDKVIITYDLAKIDKDRFFDIEILVFIDGNELRPTALEGEMAFVRDGKGKKIIWDVFSDVTELSGKMEVEITARPSGRSNNNTNFFNTTTPNNQPESIANIEKSISKMKIPAFAGFGGVAALGGGLLFTGITKQGTDAVNEYTAKCDKNSPDFDESMLVEGTDGTSPCDHLYEEANSDYKGGSKQLMIGAAVALAGGAILLKRVLDIKQLKSKYLSLKPTFEFDNVNQGGILTQGMVGLKLTYTF